jgi:hypothetical protein
MEREDYRSRIEDPFKSTVNPQGVALSMNPLFKL